MGDYLRLRPHTTLDNCAAERKVVICAMDLCGAHLMIGMRLRVHGAALRIQR